MGLFARFGSNAFFASLIPLAIAACSSAPADPSASTDQRLIGNSADPHSTVDIRGTSNALLQFPCTGTAITSSWVLTSSECAKAAVGRTLQVCHGTGCLDVGGSYTHPTLPIAMLKVQGTLSVTGMPQLATTLPKPGNVIFCTGASDKQGVFTVSALSGDDVYASNTSLSQATNDEDRGGGAYLFDDTDIFGVITPASLSGGESFHVSSILGAEAWILGFTGPTPVCGGATCGSRVVDGTYVSCGMCLNGTKCDGTKCVLPPHDPCNNQCSLPFVCDSATKKCVTILD